jgi:hypothetical protein
MTKKIEVPISFEDVYINGKDWKSYGKEEDDILSELNKRIIKALKIRMMPKRSNILY